MTTKDKRYFHLRLLGLGVCVVALGACAMASGRSKPASQSAPPTAPVADSATARQQLAHYVAIWQRGRRQLGLGPQNIYQPHGQSPKAVPSAPSREQVTKKSSLDAAAESSRVQMDDAAGAPARRYRVRRSKAVRSRISRCPMPCRVTRSICNAAKNICRLADYLKEADARSRCSRAKADCTKAKEKTAGQCSATCATP